MAFTEKKKVALSNLDLFWSSLTLLKVQWLILQAFHGSIKTNGDFILKRLFKKRMDATLRLYN